MKVVAVLLLIGVMAVAADNIINQEFLNGYNNFTRDVYNELRKTNPGNFLVSPLSVDILLALMEYGSSGETSKQLMRGLSLPEKKDKINEAFSSLTPKLNVTDKYTLTSANKIYVKEGRPLLENFKKLAVDVYNAEVQNINFNNSEAAANEINKWVGEKTQNKIQNLVNKKLLDEYTRVLLVNSLYFHGNWVTKFNSSNTKKDVFHLADGSESQVDFMDINTQYKYYENSGLKFLELPYDGDDVSMTIVLPNDNNGFSTLENDIQQALTTPPYKMERVHVKIPKFKIETKIEFNEVLQKLNITNAFEDTAEFLKITGEPLKISSVVQKALIEVEEEGTTAAAATVAYVSLTRSGHAVRETKEFIANRPFVFILSYKSVVLFIGHYTGK